MTQEQTHYPDADATPNELDAGYASAAPVTTAVTGVRELLDQFRAEPGERRRIDAGSPGRAGLGGSD